MKQNRVPFACNCVFSFVVALTQIWSPLNKNFVSTHFIGLLTDWGICYQYQRSTVVL